jgi:hypothetical protein
MKNVVFSGYQNFVHEDFLARRSDGCISRFLTGVCHIDANPITDQTADEDVEQVLSFDFVLSLCLVGVDDGH